MKRYIHVTKENRKFLAKTFKVTDRMVDYALRYERNSGLAEKIRTLAVLRGGIVMNISPEIQTFHDYDNYMRQYLPNGAMLEFSKTDGSGDVLFKGDVVRHYDQVRMGDISGIQNWAAALR